MSDLISLYGGADKQQLATNELYAPASSQQAGKSYTDFLGHFMAKFRVLNYDDNLLQQHLKRLMLPQLRRSLHGFSPQQLLRYR